MRIIALALALLSASALAVPQQMTYEGFLTDLADRPYEGAVTLGLALYASESSSEAIWSEEIEGVAVRAGYFTLMIGDRVPLPDVAFENDDLYFGITVDGGEILPRARLASVAFARRAGQANDVAGQAIHPGSVSIGDRVVIDENGRWVGDPTGLAGPQGERGLQGDQGIRGVQGEIGAQGDQGIRGVQGETGAQGDQGIPGVQGETGAQGGQGTQGVQGEIGAQGDQGIRGVQGEIGAQGIRGVTGATGTRGEVGPQGAAGSQGGIGATGARGLPGATGSQGPAGPSHWTSQASCPGGTAQIYPGLCIDTSWRTATRADTAGRNCLAIGAHLCSYTEMSAACFGRVGNVYGAMSGRWIGNACGDDCVLCGNNNTDCSNFEDTCNKNNSRTYKCCYSIHSGAY